MPVTVFEPSSKRSAPGMIGAMETGRCPDEDMACLLAGVGLSVVLAQSMKRGHSSAPYASPHIVMLVETGDYYAHRLQPHNRCANLLAVILAAGSIAIRMWK